MIVPNKKFTIAVIGKDGSGKSSLASSLMMPRVDN